MKSFWKETRVKLDSMEKLSSLKQQLNNELSKEFSAGKDVSLYKEPIDELERELRHLYYLNGKTGFNSITRKRDV